MSAGLRRLRAAPLLAAGRRSLGTALLGASVALRAPLGCAVRLTSPAAPLALQPSAALRAPAAALDPESLLSLVAALVMGKPKGGKDGGGGEGAGKVPFRNPHNLPTKVCVVCNRPFNWRKKWEKCWDEVLTCSNRCKSERKGRKQQAGGAENEEDEVDDDSDSTSSDGGAKAKGGRGARRGLKAQVAEDRAEADLVDAPAGAASSGDDDEGETLTRAQRRANKMAAKARSLDLAASSGDDDGGEILTKAQQRKANKQAAKAEKRAVRAMTDEAVAAKRKPCDLCERPVDLLVRCTTDKTGAWRMACGRCWKEASGGMPDGDADHPHYRYGGLWKNRAANVNTPSFGKALAAKLLAEVAAEDAAAAGGPAAAPGTEASLAVAAWQVELLAASPA